MLSYGTWAVEYEMFNGLITVADGAVDTLCWVFFFDAMCAISDAWCVLRRNGQRSN